MFSSTRDLSRYPLLPVTTRCYPLLPIHTHTRPTFARVAYERMPRTRARAVHRDEKNSSTRESISPPHPEFLRHVRVEDEKKESLDQDLRQQPSERAITSKSCASARDGGVAFVPRHTGILVEEERADVELLHRRSTLFYLDQSSREPVPQADAIVSRRTTT